MAAKGQLKPPVAPLQRAFQHAMDVIDSADCQVAIFMVGGEVMATKQTSMAFNNNIERLSSGLVGVYDMGADARGVLEDLGEFYK